MTFSTVLLLISVGTFAYWKYRKFIKWADNIPGYDEPFFSKPVFRALFAGRRSKWRWLCMISLRSLFYNNFLERLEIIMDLATQYPIIYRLMFGPLPKIFIMDPELVKKVLTSTKCLKKPNFYRFFGWGNGLATAQGIRSKTIFCNFIRNHVNHVYSWFLENP